MTLSAAGTGRTPSIVGGGAPPAPSASDASEATAHPPSAGYTLYLDESGDHGLVRVNPEYPVLALCGIAVDDARDSGHVAPSVDQFKVEQFGNANVALHYRAMAQKAGPFSFLADPSRAWAFEGDLAQLVRRLDMTVFCAAINKAEYVVRHGRTRPVDRYLPTNLYLMALDFVLERFVKLLEEEGTAAGRVVTGRVIAETRGARENEELREEYDELRRRGTQFVSAIRFRRVLWPELQFAEKSARLAGLELADVCAAPIATQVLKPGTPSAMWEAIAPKIWVSGVARKGHLGLKVFPRSAALDSLFGGLAQKKSPGGP
jgi:hypothetical protein